MNYINFWSGKNYMKRDSTSANLAPINAAAPTVSKYGGAFYATDITINHGLGIIPMFSMYYEPFGDGVIWQPLPRSLGGNYFQNPINPGQYGPGLYGWVDINNVYLQLRFPNNTLTGTFPVYCVIYRDYGIV
jgi:hypothetical protein